MVHKNDSMDSCSSTQGAQECHEGRRGSIRVLALCAMVLALAGPALGQFTVQPMKLDLQLRPGKLVKTVVEITSLDPNETNTIDLSIVDLSQNRDGGWQIIEPNSGFDLSKLSSCRESVTISPSTITVEPLQVRPVELTLTVPRGSKGFSCAGLLATMRPRAGASMVDFTLRFMVPIILEIQGKPGRNIVEATDMSMEFAPGSPRMPATTMLTMTVKNNGETFPRCRPVARLWSFTGGHWRTITTTAFQDNSSDIGVIPGAEIVIKTNLKRSLPPGKYRIAAVLYVDSQRTKRIEKEFEFAGDPSVKTVAADTPLDIPGQVTVKGIPGSTRSTVLKVYNGSDETVNVRATLAFPRDLGTKVVQSVPGVNLDCTNWVKVEPSQFTLRGEGGSENVRVTVAVPDSATQYPYYYTDLNFWAFYPDGQNAGLTTTNMCLQNDTVSAQPLAKAVKLVPHVVTGSQYQIVAQFSNTGIVHFDAKRAKAAVTMGVSTVPRLSTKLESAVTGVMLPGEERNFSGIIDFSALDPGVYRLSAAIEYAPDQWASKQEAIQVSIESGQRVVNVIGTEEDLPQVLEVQWSRIPAKPVSGNERG